MLVIRKAISPKLPCHFGSCHVQKLEAACVESTQGETMYPLLRWKEGMSITPRWISFSTLSRVKNPLSLRGAVWQMQYVWLKNVYT